MAEYKLSVIFLDAFNRKTRREYVILSADEAAAIVSADALIAATDPIVECGIVKYTLSRTFDQVTTVTAGADVGQGLTMTWELNTLGSEKLGTSKLPGPIPGIFDANGNLDLSHAGILVYEGKFTDGTITISDGEQPVDLKKGKLDK